MPKIFVVGFPKAGTSSMQSALEVIGLKSVHHHLKDGRVGYVGMLIKRAKKEKLPLLHYLSEFDAFTQMDVSYPNACYWPQLVDVPLLDQQYPNSKFIYNMRPTHKWIRSISWWGNLRVRLGSLDIPGLPPGIGYMDRELIAWHNWHLNNMKNYFAGRKDFIIFDIENDNPQKLGDFLGVKNFVWMHKNKNKKKPQ